MTRILFIASLSLLIGRAAFAKESITCAAGQNPVATTPQNVEPRPLTLKCRDAATREIKREDSTKYCPAGQKWRIWTTETPGKLEAECVPQ
jgi:hypothetical protein